MLAERKILDDRIRSRTERREERSDDRFGKRRHDVTVALFVRAVTAESEPAFEVPWPATHARNSSPKTHQNALFAITTVDARRDKLGDDSYRVRFRR